VVVFIKTDKALVVQRSIKIRLFVTNFSLFRLFGSCWVLLSLHTCWPQLHSHTLTRRTNHCTHLHTQKHTHTPLTHTQTHVHTHIHTHAHTRTTYTHMHTHTHTHTNTPTQIHTQTQVLHMSYLLLAPHVLELRLYCSAAPGGLCVCV
jgi:hypothetical protein